MIKSNTVSQAVAKSPILWGSLATVGFYGLIRAGVLQGQFIQDYFTRHPVEYVETALFFVGLAALVLKAVDVALQYSGLSESHLGPMPKSRQTIDQCGSMLDRLNRLPERRQNDYLTRRLRDAVEHVQRRSSADTLDDQLKYLADCDANRQYGSYGLARIIIWAIPILGFLGTVIGIMQAIGMLSPQALEESLPVVIDGLGIAFNTTALALALSIVLMFAQFLVDRFETGLLSEVDRRVADQLEGRFEVLPTGNDGQLVAFQRVAETMTQVTERLVRRQTELWSSSMEVADHRWSQMADTAGSKLREALSSALADSLQTHAQTLAETESNSIQESRQYWEQVRQTQMQTTQAMASLQASMTAQAETLGRAVEAAGEVTRLEDTLNRNLSALAGAKNFEQTVMSLAAAIHLLNARISELPGGSTSVQLQPSKDKPQAA